MAHSEGGTFIKDPDATLDFIWDWSQWLKSGETIVNSQFLIQQSGLEVETESNSATDCTAWLSGGAVGIPYVVTNRITTNEGRIDDRSITIRVTER